VEPAPAVPFGATPPTQPTPWPVTTAVPPPAPRRQRNRTLLGLGGAAAAVIAAVVLFIVLPDGDDPPGATTTVPPESTTTGPDAGSAVDVEVPEGFVAFVNEIEGFGLAVPESWEDFDLTDPAVTTQLEEFFQANPNLGGVVEESDFAGGLFSAMDAESPPGFLTNLLIDKSLGEARAADIEDGVAQLESLGYTNVESTEVELPVGAGFRIDYQANVNSPEGETTQFDGVQVLVPVDGFTWQLTFSAGDMDSYEEIFDQMIESFAVAD
jgi:hypothetical protein